MFICSFNFNSLNAQCSEFIDAGQDKFLCEHPDGSTVILSASVGGNPIFTTWEPTNLVDDFSEITTTATVSETTVFTITAFHLTTNNLVENGNFENGNTGFSSEYGHTITSLGPEGLYAISTNPRNHHGNFAPCPDHTTGNGNMMVVNGAPNSGEEVWCQTIDVVQGAFYSFSIWVTSVHPASPARLEFTINGQTLGAPIVATQTTCEWVPFAAFWEAETSTTAEICIVNQNLAASGNDFAIDDISFTEICQVSDYLTVYVDEMELTISEPEELNCDNSETTLTADYSSPFGDDFLIGWSTEDGSIVGDAFSPTITVDAPGTYTFTFFNHETGCSLIEDVVVIGDVGEPFVDAGENIDIDCNVTEIILDGSNSDEDDDLVYLWTTDDGNIIAGEDGLMPQVDMPGTYTLTISNQTNGCVSEASVIVNSIVDLPAVFAVSDEPINCTNESIVLNGTGSLEGDDITYLWTTEDGNILSGEDELNPEVDMPGTYTLTVFNAINGCQQSADVLVIEDLVEPIVMINGPSNLTCASTTLLLNAGGSDLEDDFTLLWTTTNGNITSDATSSEIEIDQAGEYLLTIINNENGCANSLPYSVGLDDNIPEAMIEPALSLDCNLIEQNLDASNSSQGPNITYNWSSTNGNILSGENDLMPLINAPGIYVLLITNTENGCTNTVDVTINQNILEPLVNIQAPEVLNCINQTTDLSIENNGNANYSYQWSSSDGTILANGDGANPSVEGIGTYFLTTTNMENGCTSINEITVTENITVPSVDIDLPLTINCLIEEVTLNATDNPFYSYEWSTNNGSIAFGADQSNPIVSSAGIYELVVTNNDNGCTSGFSIEVEEDLIQPDVEAGPNALLTCNQEDLNLNGGTNSSDVSILWTTENGSILSGIDNLNPLINAPGIYTLTITNNSNGCFNEDSVEIGQDLNAPISDAGEGGEMNCNIETFQLNGGASSSGPNINFEWTTMDGNFLSMQNTLSPEVNAPGTYLLTITNLDNQCSTVSSVIVSQNLSSPEVDFSAPQLLSCTLQETTISNLIPDLNNILSYDWQSNTDSFSEGLENGEIIINEAGTYQVTVINNESFCEETFEFEVFENLESPMVNAGENAILSCIENTLTLNGEASSSDNNLTYLWSTVDGNIMSGANSLNPEINEAGTYTLTVLNESNGCESNASLLIGQDEEIPEVSIDQPVTLNCEITSQTLNATNNNADPTFTYVWTSVDGNILSGEDSLNPNIDVAGTYVLTITNETNGCSSIEEVTVVDDLLVPLADASSLGILSCTNQSVLIQANNIGATDVSFNWSTSNGNIIGDPNGESTEVDQAGTYLLTITSLINQCSNTIEVIVEQDENTPLALIENETELNCNTQQITLDALASSQGDNIQFDWSTDDGNFLEGSDSLSPVINEAGTYTLHLIDTNSGCETYSTVLIIENFEAPELAIPEVPILNCSLSSFVFNLENEEFEFVWTDQNGSQQNGDQIEVLEAGILSCLVTDPSNGCTSTFQIEVLEDIIQPIVIIEETSMLDCDNLSLILNANNSSNGNQFTYTWTSIDGGNIISGANALNPEINAAGTYILNILNTENQCEDQAQITIEENIAIPTLSIEPPLVIDCNNPQININAITAGDPNFTFEWTSSNGNIIGNNNNQMLTVDSDGTYQLLLTNNTNSCTNTAMIDVFMDVENPIADPGNDYVLTCTNPEINLSGEASSSGDEYEYLWTTEIGNLLSGENTLNPLVDGYGFYTLLVSNTINGCTSEATIEVFENMVAPIINVEEPELLTCSNESTLLIINLISSDDYSIEWTTTDGNISSDAANEIPEVNQAGTYTVEIIDLTNGCSSEETILVLQDIESPLAEAGEGVELTCSLTSFELQATGSVGSIFDYSWTSTDGTIQSGENSLTPIVNAAGTYQLTILNTDNGCSAIDDVIITQNEDVPTSIDALANPPLCFGESGSIVFTNIDGGIGPFLYSIDGGENYFSEMEFSQLDPGIYNLLIQDMNGCELSEILEIPGVDPIDVELIPEIELFLGESSEINSELLNINENEIESIIWTPSNGLSCSDCLNPVATPSSDIIYTLNIVTENGCQTSAEIAFKVKRTISIYIPNTFTPYNQDGINDVFFINALEGSVKNVSSFQVYDRWGTKVFTDANFLPNDPAHGWNGNYRTNKMNPGVFVYYAVIEFIDGSTQLFEGDVTLLD